MYRVFIGVGHGGGDPGAVSGSLREAELNLAMALAMQAELVRSGVAVGMSRTVDEADPLYQEIVEANAFKPDLAVEVHNNAGGGDGFEVYRQQSGPYAAKSLQLAGAIEAEVKKIGQNSRGIKGEKSPAGYTFGWLSGCKCPAVLCEGAFIDNATDAQIVDTVKEQEAFGVAYAKAVLAVLGVAWTEPEQRLYRVQSFAGSKAGAEAYAEKLRQLDVDGAAVPAIVV